MTGELRKRRTLVFFLSAATFFEGFDFFALSQVLPNVRQEFALAPEFSAYLTGFVNLGTMLAFFVVRASDAIGRSRTLMWTISAYGIFTAASAFAPNIWVFAVCQLFARIFLLGEWGVSMLIAAEEMPAERRASTLSIIQIASSLGGILCAATVPFLLRAHSWRAVYFAGALPVVLLAYLRYRLLPPLRVESARSPSMWEIWRRPERKTMLLLSMVWGLSYVPSSNAVSLWKEFARGERGYTDGDVGLAVSIAALVALPSLYWAGRWVDRVGRRLGATVLLLLGAAAYAASYTLTGRVPLQVALALSVFSASAYLPVLNTISAELFSRELRATTYAWANNLLGRLLYVLGPFAVGAAVESFGSFGPVVAATASLNLVAVALLWRLPEPNRDAL